MKLMQLKADSVGGCVDLLQPAIRDINWQIRHQSPIRFAPQAALSLPDFESRMGEHFRHPQDEMPVRNGKFARDDYVRGNPGESVVKLDGQRRRGQPFTREEII